MNMLVVTVCFQEDPFDFQHGADVNKKNRDGHTPLDLVKEGDQDVADLLRGTCTIPIPSYKLWFIYMVLTSGKNRKFDIFFKVMEKLGLLKSIREIFRFAQKFTEILVNVEVKEFFFSFLIKCHDMIRSGLSHDYIKIEWLNL